MTTVTVNTKADYAAFLLRVTMGIFFLAHAGLKIFVFTPAGAAGYFGSLGLPGGLAYLTILAELAGVAALIVGVATRLVAVALIPVLLGAVWVHSGNGWLFSSEGGGWEFPLFWAIVQGAIALLGGGAYALKPSARGLVTA